MGIFSRKESSDPANQAMAELGREYGIAKRHGDRKTMGRINHRLGSEDVSAADLDSFRQGRKDYEDIPPAYSKPRRSRRR